MHLIVEKLQLATEQPIVVDFRPWLVNDRDALLSSLFGQLAAAVEQIQREKPTAAAAIEIRNTAKGLRDFAKRASKLGPLASAVASVVPGGGLAVEVMRQIVDGVAAVETDAALAELKDRLSASLAAIDRRIVVTIDDVDRLEPREAVELLRLVRAVADFPNVTYVLCFDEEVLAHNVETALGIQNGHNYIEKIVQVVIPVPTPEAFDLRRWFETELALMVGDLDRKQRNSLSRAIDLEGGRRLLTPRAVIRVLDSLRIKVPALSGMVDLGDLVCLELIKIGNMALYRWIEDYCTSAAALWPGVSTTNEEAAQMEFKKLETLLSRDSLTFQQLEWELDDRLPQIGHFDEKRLFVDVQADAQAAAIRDRRLASPDHHRLYFALAAPRNSLSTQDIAEFEDAGNTSAEALEALLLEWLPLQQTNRVSLAEVALNRLSRNAIGGLSAKFSGNLLSAISNIMDIAAISAPRSPLGSFALWSEGDRLWPYLIGDGEAGARSSVISLFSNGSSLSWLSDKFRDELFAHGKFGLSKRGGGILREDEVDEISPIMIGRLRKAGIKAVLALPAPIGVLYAWADADIDHVRSELAKHVRRNSAFLDFLQMLTSVATSSIDGERTILQKSTIERLLDYGAVTDRLTRVSTGGSGDKARAKALLANLAAERR